MTTDLPIHNTRGNPTIESTLKARMKRIDFWNVTQLGSEYCLREHLYALPLPEFKGAV